MENPLVQEVPEQSPVKIPNIDHLIEDMTPRLMRAGMALGFDPVQAEELVQDTFVAFLEARGRFQGRSKISTFLFGILYNKARELRRARGKEPSLEAMEESFNARFDSSGHWTPRAETEILSQPEMDFHTRQTEESLRECLDGLDTTLRMAFTMKEAEGASTDDICAALHITANHLGVVLFRARNKLRDCLKSKSVSPA